MYFWKDRQQGARCLSFLLSEDAGKIPWPQRQSGPSENQLFTVSGSISRVTGHGVNGNNGNGAFTAACNLIDISRAFR